MVTLVKNTETIGLWVEMVICRLHNIQFNTTRSYIKDLKFDIEDNFVNCLKKATNDLTFKEHIGHKLNNADFLLIDGSRISVKTNITGDKCCPPRIGQTTLSKLNFESNLKYKEWVLSKPHEVFDFYSNAMFETDYIIYVNFSNGETHIIKKQNKKQLTNFSFTKNLKTWKESCTMKIDGKAIAEFQVHNNRNSVKCRFNMSQFLELYKSECHTFTKSEFKISKTIGTFNYIGSKTKLLPFLKSNIEDYIFKPISDISSFYDLFAGTGVVSSIFIENGCKTIITNDNMYYSYILCSCLTNKNINIEKISVVIEQLNTLPPINGYISNTYSNNRMYFTPENAQKIDSIRTSLEENKQHYTTEEYNLLIKILLYSCSKVANISSTYGAYLKKFKKTSTVDLKLTKTALECLYSSDTTIKNYNLDILKFVSEININGDVCYLDPPYNSRKYSSNYFVIDSIANYNKVEVSNGITGVPLTEPTGSGSFCSKNKAQEAFNILFNKIDTNYLFMSYNSESILSKNDIVSLLEKNNWKNVKVVEEEYQRFKSNSNTKQQKTLFEYLFCATRS